MNEAIIFFDGLCPMCHGWVRRIIRWDTQKRFRFSPLEGELAKARIRPLKHDYLEENSIVLLIGEKIFLRSQAILKIVNMLGWPYKIIGIAYVIPSSVRDICYKLIARNRNKWGKRYTSCPAPPEKWLDRFV